MGQSSLAPALPNVEKKFGKPIDVDRFKQNNLDLGSLLKTKRSFADLSKKIRASRKKIFVRECYICGSRKRREVATVYGIPYLECSQCDHLYAKYRLSSEDLAKFYKTNKSYSQGTYANRKIYEYRLQQVAYPKVDYLKKFIKTRRKKWLDIGSGIGDIVAAAMRRGYDARGLELSDSSVEFGKKVFKANLSQETLEQVLKKEGKGSYDIITFFGVIEHIPNPKEQVKLAKQLLSPKGLLVLEVPNANSISALSDFVYPNQVVRQMFPPFHIMVYSQKSLKKLVTSYGFKPEAMWFLGLDFFNLLLHMGMSNKNVLNSPLAQVLISRNNEFQQIIDEDEMSDQMILISRKASK